MDLKELERTWNNYGLKDPLWAVLTWREKQGGRWDVGEFFENGRIEIESAMKRVRSLAPSLKRRKALDFGCGVGRLTQALACHFDEYSGPRILDQAIS
jgi:tRNA/tmRNA/rRNA uracil-C5-methylase (TrmA/RlmC/RlmD family)